MRNPKNMTPEGLTTLRNFEADELVRRGEMVEGVSALAGSIADLVEALLEHWTDDEGLHYLPFRQDLKEQLEERLGTEMHLLLPAATPNGEAR